MWEGRNGILEVKLSTLLPLHQAAPPSLQVPSWPRIRIMLKEGKGRLRDLLWEMKFIIYAFAWKCHKKLILQKQWVCINILILNEYLI